jgi:Bifunctional DNA primase/polymerase, N-terminal
VEYAPPPPEGEGVLACALHYGRCVGWRVFPVRADKTPLVKDWPNVATADEGRIREWWSRWPEAGIGLATGRASGVYIVDIDPGHDGLASWERLDVLGTRAAKSRGRPVVRTRKRRTQTRSGE